MRVKSRGVLFQIILKKGKITLFPFFLYSGELHAGKVNLRGVYKREPLNRRAKRKTPIAPSKGRTMGFS